ncbi:uncharacterized protein N7458_001536 [Penicillium daleae]|uniref:Pectate lyase superfamily protein domain-containing protein n=1 Tax=Penicillium daleae TaxID=63821 RepID=A0AAD6G508_9EURO|nr:uncharacterized protein N7458_001536 [Penicillium daleae]KAJ5459984.1 hypothetical protein N7458_001536 [Penicillium daleae]
MFLTTLLLQALLLVPVWSHYYVAVNGNDFGPGSATAPFRTLERAQAAVQRSTKGMRSDIYVYVGPGTYYLNEPLKFTSEDSGQHGHRVIWQAQDMIKGVNISGGVRITKWKASSAGKGIYEAQAPAFTTRHFYANQAHAQRARAQVQRSWVNQTATGLKVVNDSAKYILTMPGLEHAEFHAHNSFTSRYNPVTGASNDTIFMAQPAWNNNIIGYDSFNKPDVDHGLYVENALSLLTDPNEWYLDPESHIIYYMPPSGQDPSNMYLVLAKLETLLLIGGTYDQPVHDLTFRGFNYMHTTWNVGYVDQQTGGYIGTNKSYTNFEASRPFWWQVPGSIQVSAAQNILFQNGSIVALMGGFGIGNDPNAHTTGVGLGASDVEISGMLLHQTGANAITLGGIQANAHHPSDPRMLNQNTRILENIFTDLGYTIDSAVPIFASYAKDTYIVHNDIVNVPYSGICYGYGWGSNDAGGSPQYQLRGLYNYQPVYNTPTTMQGGRISANLLYSVGTLHSDDGGIYTLSASPNTTLSDNWVKSPQAYGTYT